jgi:hypothetical protein
MPRVDPRTGSIPRVDPRTGSIPRVDPRTGSIPRIDPRTGEMPRMDPRTGDMPILGPPTGENRIVPLVRGGDRGSDSRRRAQQARPVSHRPETGGSSSPFRPALLIAAAAAVLGAAVGAGAVVAGPWADNSTSPTGIQAAGGDLGSSNSERLAATDSETGVHADVALASKPWGTQVAFSVTDLDGPRKCRLVAVLADGKTEVLSSWTVPEQGYNEGTEPPQLKLDAATSVNRRDIAALRVQDISQDGKATTLVTVRA